jgi:4-hydroxy-tetrahydrodipicolinate synthase
MPSSTLAASASRSPESPPAPGRAALRLGVALVTPFARDGSVDLARLRKHARRVLDEGCASVTLFGTTGEGASLGMAQRASMLEALDDAGFDLATQVLAGVAASSVEDAAAQANQLYDAGGRGILLAPPFYFKGVDDEGVYRWFASVIERCRAPREVVVYHIPQVTGVPGGSALVGRLSAAFPGVVTAGEGFERRLGVDRAAARRPSRPAHPGRRRAAARAGGPHGGSGAINGFANFCARAILPMIERGDEVPGIKRARRRAAATPGHAGGEGAGRASLRRRRVRRRRAAAASDRRGGARRARRRIRPPRPCVNAMTLRDRAQ